MEMGTTFLTKFYVLSQKMSYFHFTPKNKILPKYLDIEMYALSDTV